MNKYKSPSRLWLFLGLGLLSLAGLFSPDLLAAAADPTSAITAVSAAFDTISVLAVAMVTFWIVLRLVKRAKG